MPFFEHAKRESGALAIEDCEKCKACNSRQIRQHMACGYEPPIEGALPWEHTGRKVRDDEPKICAGYVCNLPEVIEIARAHLHWSKGSLRDFCRGDAPDTVLYGVEVFEGACNSLSNWLMKPKDER